MAVLQLSVLAEHLGINLEPTTKYAPSVQQTPQAVSEVVLGMVSGKAGTRGDWKVNPVYMSDKALITRLWLPACRNTFMLPRAWH